MTQEVLVVDDDPVQRRLVEALAASAGLRSLSCDSGRAALEVLAAGAAAGRFAAMVLDLSMPGLSGLDVLERLRHDGLDVPVIVLTGNGGIESAVAAMRAGAFDFVVKPAAPDRLRAMLERAVRAGKARRRRASESGRADARLTAAGLGGAMAPVIAQARRAAASTIPVLIEGETGSGKEWLAEAIRAAGPRAAGPFVAVNCAALPVQLAESILFGHAKGAFTDAAESRPGKFLEADGGTLFLDEIGELPIDLQAKLLRVLQNGEVDPVGGRGTRRVDARILTATNRSLGDQVAAGRFREDLFFRLAVLSIRVPPLRERRGEIPALAEGFLASAAAAEGRAGLRFAPGVAEALASFEWPGNVRQLENAVHRAVVLAEGQILDLADFPQLAPPVATDSPASAAAPAPRPTPAPPAMSRAPVLDAFEPGGEIRRADAVEADLIRLALARYGGRVNEVARRLGIGRSTLYRKLREHRIAAGETPSETVAATNMVAD